MKFKEQLKIIEEALLKPATDEEADQRNVDYWKPKFEAYLKENHAILNADGRYDLNNSFYLSSLITTEDEEELDLPKLPVKFGKINGNFNISMQELKTLDGCPVEVAGDFYAYANSLTNLIGAPNIVKGKFCVDNNNLTSLEGCPKFVGGIFDIRMNARLFTEKEIRDKCNIGGKVSLDE